jgi:transcriptional pleiotropic regulator of transition state genes
MKDTGIVRKIDELGRIVIPMEIRRVLGINQRDEIEIFTEGDRVILTKYQPNCSFCASSDKLKTFKGKQVCQKCINDLKKKA